MVRGTELGLWSWDLVLNRFCHKQCAFGGKPLSLVIRQPAVKPIYSHGPQGAPGLPGPVHRRPRSVGRCYLKSGVSCVRMLLLLSAGLP